MLTLLKNIECFCPRYIGEKDIVIAGSAIYKIIRPGELGASMLVESIIDCRGLYAFPGFIDQHVHFAGAGGEEGFFSRTRELNSSELFEAGITTAVGLLGADGTTRSMENLYAKAKALEAVGLSTYIYSGSYGMPPVTLTGSMRRDIVYIDKVIGAGEIAIADHRSSNPSASALVQLASEVHMGGLLAGKAGVVHLHVGDGKGGLSVLTDAIRQSDLLPEVFVPTHLNRNPALFRQAVAFGRSGGRIDLTAGEKAGLAVADAVKTLLSEGVELSHVTVSSDGGGSIPAAHGGGNLQPSGIAAASPSALFDDFKEIIKRSVLPPEKAAGLFTENVAGGLRIHPKKGALREGSDADILITDKEYQLKMLFCMGKPVVNRAWK